MIFTKRQLKNTPLKKTIQPSYFPRFITISKLSKNFMYRNQNRFVKKKSKQTRRNCSSISTRMNLYYFRKPSQNLNSFSKSCPNKSFSSLSCSDNFKFSDVFLLRKHWIIMRSQNNNFIAFLQRTINNLLKNRFYPSFVRKIIIQNIKERSHRYLFKEKVKNWFQCKGFLIAFKRFFHHPRARVILSSFQARYKHFLKATEMVKDKVISLKITRNGNFMLAIANRKNQKNTSPLYFLWEKID